MATTAVYIRDKQIWVGDSAYPLLSSEVHFWRLQPQSWLPVLREVRALGLDMIATYVCWDYHELAPGDYDFTGRSAPTRNLIGFLELVAAEGFKLILRPGPYIYSEWRNAGIPDHAVPFHRLHPSFLAAAQPYMQAVVEAARPFLATRGGPIVLWQAENEPDPWPHFYEEQLGLGTAPGLFQQFLQTRYADVEALNSAWECHYERIAQAQAVTRPVFHDRAYLNRYRDFCGFRAWYAAECVRWTAGAVRGLGVDVPILANTYVTPQIGDWRTFETAGAADVAGPDLYPVREFRRSADAHRDFLDTLRRTRTYSALPVIPEFQAGIWHGGQEDTGVLPPNHYRLICLSALLAGIAGWNWYMLVGRDNWLWSPINEWGNPRPDLAHVFGQIVRLYRRIDPPRLQKLTSTAAVLNVHDPLPGESGDAVLRALYAADVDIEMYDAETGQVARPLLFYAGGEWLSQTAQQKLLAEVEAGAHLVFFQTIPQRDEHDNFCNAFGLPRPPRILNASHPQRLRVLLDGDDAVLSAPAFFSYDALPENATPIRAERVQDALHIGSEMERHEAFPVERAYTVGYVLRRGAGTVSVLGVPPTPELVAAVHRWRRVPIPSRAEGPYVQTALFRSGGQDDTYVLVAVNNGDEARTARIDLAPEIVAGRADLRLRDLISGATTPVLPDGRTWLYLEAKSGTAALVENAHG